MEKLLSQLETGKEQHKCNTRGSQDDKSGVDTQVWVRMKPRVSRKYR